MNQFVGQRILIASFGFYVFAVLQVFPDQLPRRWSTSVWPADNGQNTTWLWGVGLAGPATESIDVSASCLQGQYNQGGDIEETSECLLLVGTEKGIWNAGVGFSYLSFKTGLQRGFVWSYPEEEAERNADIYGPVVYVGMRYPITETPAGLYATLLALPYDFGNLDDLGYRARYAEFQAGWFRAGTRIWTSIGYQVRIFDDVPDRIINDRTFPRDRVDGMFAQLGFRF